MREKFLAQQLTNMYIFWLTNIMIILDVLLKYSKTENVKHLKQIQHPLIKHALKLTKILGVDINSVSDVSSGTGWAALHLLLLVC